MFTWVGGDIGIGWSICFKYSLSSNILRSPPPGLCLTFSNEPILLSALTSIFWLIICKAEHDIKTFNSQKFPKWKKICEWNFEHSVNKLQQFLFKSIKKRKIKCKSTKFVCWCLKTSSVFCFHIPAVKLLTLVLARSSRALNYSIKFLRNSRMFMWKLKKLFLRSKLGKIFSFRVMLLVIV